MDKTLLTSKGVTLRFAFLTLLFLSSISLNNLIGQTVFWSEDFETNGTGTRYTANNQFIDGLDGGVEDFFGRISYNSGTPRVEDLPCAGVPNANIDITNPFGAPNGNFFIAGEDMNDAINSGGCGSANTSTPVRSVLFSGINITGASAITGKILVANGASDGCDVTSARWDEGEGLKVFTNVDGMGETPVLCFAWTPDCGSTSFSANEPLYTDNSASNGGACSGNGTGGTFVSNTFTEYDFTVTTGSGFTSMDLRIEIDADASDEEIAFDYIRLLAVNPPLPVELISFKANERNDVVSLSWTTASEINNDYFEVEHSRDGILFETIGRVDGKGTTAEINQYSFNHDYPLNGENYYRLKQNDFDGMFEYSQIRVVDYKIESDNIAVVPNPFFEKIDINLVEPFKSDVNYKVYDVTGRIVFIGVIQKNKLSVSVDLSSIKSGIYILSIQNEGDVILHNIVKI